MDNIIASLPTDPASLFALALIVGVAVLLYYVGRSNKGGKPDKKAQ